MKELEKYLILNKYFLSLFGFENFNQLREKLKDTDEGYSASGKSFFADTLIGIKPGWEPLLLKYDEAIKKYVNNLKQNRKQPDFKLKYFQYLAVLFTEIFFDKYFNNKAGFLNDINRYLNTENLFNRSVSSLFTETGLKKLAYWMATGSGKTIIMHINFWQILKYSGNIWDNIILITPNEGLSKQHYLEMTLSGIPCVLYTGSNHNLSTKGQKVLIIDIHKLTKEKKGKGVSVDVSYFEGKNLVFIDEGHKGQSSEEQKWKNLREEIGRDGFLLEYSATFGQVIGNNKDLLKEYVQAIIFDYSYKYFYTDGYGKDFYVYNINVDKKLNRNRYSDRQQEFLITSGLLSFYEQSAIYDEIKDNISAYNIEKPLWIFVGSNVSGKGLNSDVVKVIGFLDKITKHESFLKETVKMILEGNSGLVDDNGHDVFREKFSYIRKKGIDETIENIYQKVFNGKGRLELYEIKNADGEIGLKTSTAQKYFAVINVGDVNGLKNLLKKSGIEIKEEHLSSSLFFKINERDSYINILIGSKKFVEGWNSWRVSNMGLINMGKGEGPQIIQLFGRGVRLKGKNLSLKREENPDDKLKILQTLYISGLNADYIMKFLKIIEKEEVDYKEITIPVKFNKPGRWEEKLFTIKTNDNFDFLNHPLKLTLDKHILKNITIDLRPKITLAHGLNVETTNTGSAESVKITDEYLELIDWDFIYTRIINYKIEKQFYNLILNTDIIKEIIKDRSYKLYFYENNDIRIDRNNRIKISSFEGIDKFHDILLIIVKNYLSKYYRKEEKRKAMEYLELEPLTINKHTAMYPADNEILLKIPNHFEKELKDITKQIETYKQNRNQIPEDWKKWDSFIVHFDNHLYTPLIITHTYEEAIKSVPVKLNKGETRFLEDLKKFLEYNKTTRLNEFDELFLLRNFSRKGIGFFLNAGFYPDFIVWLKKENRQQMIFIDPKGIRNTGNFNDDKIQFCNTVIKEIEKKFKKTNPERDIKLDAFILSVTPYTDIKNIFGNGNYNKEQFEKHHILFQEDKTYLEKIFGKS